MATNVSKCVQDPEQDSTPDFLELCEHKVRSVKALANGGNFLNGRQCLDLLSKLSITVQNVQEVVSQCGESTVIFRPALENLYRYLDKANVLVTSCRLEHWWEAAVFQSRNELAFREILLDVGLCYNAIYELAKSMNGESNVHVVDLRQPSEFVFVPAGPGDVQVMGDQQDLQQRLEELVNDPSSVELQGRPLSEDSALKAKSLAKYLLLKLKYTSEQSQATALDTGSEILWTKENETSGTWGSSCFLGGGATDGGVCSTEWLGIPCAKKVYHFKEHESLFLKEAGILAHLKHPGIVNFFCCGNGEEIGGRFIAIELMEKSLYKVIEDQIQEGVYFSLPVALDIITQIARGMWYLHDQGVAHRDLKPQNVVVSKLTYSHLEDHFLVKLVDFGTSKTEVELSKSNTMTACGIGTTMYRAPELSPSANPSRKGKANWFKADVFSFAFTCAHILSLRMSFKGKEAFSNNELYNMLMDGARPKIPKYYKGPKGSMLIALLQDCWNTNPRERPSFQEICIRLENFRNICLRDVNLKELVNGGFDFIKVKMEEQSTFQQIKSYSPSYDFVEDVNSIRNATVSAIIPCTCGCKLDLVPKSAVTCSTCDICFDDWEDSDKYVRHCVTCQFSVHPECAHIKEKVNVFYHHHSLHLLVRNYNSNPDVNTICRFCEEPVQDCEWVYRCEQCDFDVHAICTKYPKERRWPLMHPHVVTLTQCPPQRSFVCTRCNGEIRAYTWRYTCTLESCAVDIHPLCTVLPCNPLCTFDISNPHQISVQTNEGSFECGRCGAIGFSWSYHCNNCKVDIHPDCVDSMDEEIVNWNEAYGKFTIEDGSKDYHIKLSIISELSDTLPISKAFEGSSSSSSKPRRVMTKVQPSSENQTSAKTPSLDASNDVQLQRKIAAETAERIEGRKMAAKEARLRLRANALEVLENLENMVVDLRSTENISQDSVDQLAAIHKKLKRRQSLVKELTTMQVQGKLSPGPRIVVLFQYRQRDGKRVRVLLTSLRPDMQEVCVGLLCEDPGHEHIVNGTTRIFNGELGEELAKKLQPLITPGLHVVMRAMSKLEAHEFTGLESVTVPCLETLEPWDLQAIDPEMYENLSLELLFEDEENVEAMRRAENSAAEWFRSIFEDAGLSILKKFGLQRVRYKEDLSFGSRGAFAWLCTERVKIGLEDGTLESYPLKYSNVEDDFRFRCPPVRTNAAV